VPCTGHLSYKYKCRWLVAGSRNPIRLFVLSFRLSDAGTKPKTRRIDYPCYEDLAALALLVRVSETCLVFRSQTGRAAALGVRSLVSDV